MTRVSFGQIRKQQRGTIMQRINVVLLLISSQWATTAEIQLGTADYAGRISVILSLSTGSPGIPFHRRVLDPLFKLERSFREPSVHYNEFIDL